MVNLSLLAKWRWRLLQGDQAIWKEVLVEKYGSHATKIIEVGSDVWPRLASKWWKDLVSLEVGTERAWLNEEVVRKVGNGLNTSFWHVAWRGEVPFKIKYPRLFSLSNQQEAMAGDLSVGGRWGFSWRRSFFVWEENLLTNLSEDLDGFARTQEVDRWRWKLEEDGCFSVNSLYTKLESVMLGENGCTMEERRVLSQIWKSGVPSKVVAFSWKLLLDRIPTRVNLEVRNCLPPDGGSNCIWCANVRESSVHLFLHCDKAREIWLNLMRWTNRLFLIPPNLFIHWECWSDGGFHKKVRRGWRMITIWVIWKARNDCIFNNVVKGVDVLVEEIKVLSCCCGPAVAACSFVSCLVLVM